LKNDDRVINQEDLHVQSISKPSFASGYFISEEKREFLRFGESTRKKNYGFTYSEPGYFTLNYYMRFVSIFARVRSNLNKSFIAGRLLGEKKFEIEVSSKTWKRLFLPKDEEVDEIIFGPHIDIDNLILKLNLTEVEDNLEEELPRLLTNSAKTGSILRINNVNEFHDSIIKLSEGDNRIKIINIDKDSPISPTRIAEELAKLIESKKNSTMPSGSTALTL